jgi:hypothetical protein
LADPGFYASLLVELIPVSTTARDPLCVLASEPATLLQDREAVDDFEDTCPCPWLLTAPVDSDLQTGR